MLVAASSAGAATRHLRTGSTPFVRVVHLRGGRLTLALTAKGRREFARVVHGKFLDGRCVRLRATPQGIVGASESGSSELVQGAGGRFVYRTLLDRRADYCDVGLATVTNHGQDQASLPAPLLDSVPLTQRGAEYLDEDQVALDLQVTLSFAEVATLHEPAGRFPASPALARTLPGVVALASAKDTPRRGKTGYYSDGADHAEVVGVSALGARLFIDMNRGVLVTNASEHLTRVLTGHVVIPGAG